MKSLFQKTLYDKRWFMVGWAGGIGLMVVAVLSFFPAFSKGRTFETLSGQIPPAFAGLIGDISSFTTVPGFIATQLYDIRIPLFLMILGLILSQSLTVNEEEKGTLRTLLSGPLSRGRVLFEKWLAGCAIIAVITLATVVASYIGVTFINESVPHELIIKLAVLTFLFGVTVVSIPFGVALATGNKGLTVAVGVITTIGSFILSSFATAVEWLKPWEVISLMYYYDAGSVLKDGINLLHVSVLVSLTGIFLIIGYLGFRSRDVSGT